MTMSFEQYTGCDIINQPHQQVCLAFFITTTHIWEIFCSFIGLRTSIKPLNEACNGVIHTSESVRDVIFRLTQRILRSTCYASLVILAQTILKLFWPPDFYQPQVDSDVISGLAKRCVQMNSVSILLILGPVHCFQRKKGETQIFEMASAAKRKQLTASFLARVCPSKLRRRFVFGQHRVCGAPTLSFFNLIMTGFQEDFLKI